MLEKLKDLIRADEQPYPAIEVDEEFHEELNSRLNNLQADNGGPLLLVRPPRENEGMDASISVYETMHNPREAEVGFGPFSAIQTNAHTHTHEIWYHDAQMQFFMRPETRVDANKLRRQIRSNYPNVQIEEANNTFPTVEPGEYVSAAKIGLKRDFYYPIKSKLHNDDSFDLDPYGEITSDMVVEEDETSDGRRVEAKECKLVVQTVFEAARDVWNKDRPYGVDVSKVAQEMQEGELHGSMLRDFEVKDASTLTKKAAKILDTLQGAKGYYITMRIIAISPYKEIAQRRCWNVSQDFETYYNSITQQGLTPIELTEEEMRQTILQAASREHNYGFFDRFWSNGKFLQPVEALGAIAHIPNEDINTPVIDWAKQETGYGAPSSAMQLEDQKRESEKNDSGMGATFGSGGSDDSTTESTGVGTRTTSPSDEDSQSEWGDTEATGAEATDSKPAGGWGDDESGIGDTIGGQEASDTSPSGSEPFGDEDNDTWGDGEQTPSPTDSEPVDESSGWGVENDQQSQPHDETIPSSDEPTPEEKEDEEDEITPAFASGNSMHDDGWDSESSGRR